MQSYGHSALSRMTIVHDQVISLRSVRFRLRKQRWQPVTEKREILIGSMLRADIFYVFYEEMSGEEEMAPVRRIVKARKKPLPHLWTQSRLGTL